MDIWPGIRRVVACIASSFTQGQRGHSLRKVSDNFRCISLLSIPGKVYPVVIMARISSHICAQLLDWQTAFRKGRGLTDSLVTIHMKDNV